ncbi:MAG: PEP-utilizing enzyme [Ignavibacteriales bacterium]|nr:PEP-utilizing enzyme [Ignavibacteriales bacterium]
MVADTGGQLSHTSIIAREFGIPAVVSVQNATRLIADGQTITLDGAAGRVYLHPSTSSSKGRPDERHFRLARRGRGYLRRRPSLPFRAHRDAAGGLRHGIPRKRRGAASKAARRGFASIRCRRRRCRSRRGRGSGS